MKICKVFFFSLIIFFVVAPAWGQLDIINRWVVAGKLSQGEAFPEGVLQEYEFFSDNKYKIYEKGVAVVNGSYKMSEDGKSFLLIGGQNSLSVKITRLTLLEVNIVYDMEIALNDTIAWYLAGTPAANLAKKKFTYAREYYKNWLALKNQYRLRNDIVISLMKTIKPKIANGNPIFSTIQEYILKSELLVLNDSYVPKVSLIQYFYIQDNLSAEIIKLLQLADDSPDLKSSPSLEDSKKKFSELEKQIETDKRKFNVSYKSYYGV